MPKPSKTEKTAANEVRADFGAGCAAGILCCSVVGGCIAGFVLGSLRVVVSAVVRVAGFFVGVALVLGTISGIVWIVNALRK